MVRRLSCIGESNFFLRSNLFGKRDSSREFLITEIFDAAEAVNTFRG